MASRSLLLLLVLALLAATAASAAGSDYFAAPVYVDSSPYPVWGGGWYRSSSLASAEVYGPVFGWREISLQSYGEGDAFLGVFTGSGFIAARVGDRYTAQLSVPAFNGSAAGAAYARYGGSTRLDVYAAVLLANGTPIVCSVASTGSWEEYPAAAWLPGGRLAVFFYNSSDRDYYLVAVEPATCSVAPLYRWDGSVYYRYAQQVAGGQGGGSVVFSFRDGGSDLALYVLVSNGSTTRAYLVANTTGGEVNGRRIVYLPSGLYLLPFVYGNGTAGYALVSPNPLQGVVEVRALGPAAPQQPTASVSPDTGEPIVVYVTTAGDIAVYTPSTGTVIVDNPQPGVDAGPFAAGLPGKAVLLAWAYQWHGYLALVNLSTGTVTPVVALNTSLWDVPAFPQGIVEANGSLMVLGSLYVTGKASGGMWMLAGLVLAPNTSTGTATGRVLLYTLPEDSGLLLDPGNPAGLLGLIRAANESIYAALAFFDNMTLAEALVEAAQRGVRVVVVTDDDSLSYPAVAYMASHGVEVYTDAGWENSTGYEHTMHHKFIVVDGRHVVIGTANPTTTGLGENYENIVVLLNATELATALTREALDLVGNGYGTSDRVDVFAGKLVYDTAAGDIVSATVYAGPEHRLDWQLETVVRIARSSIDMAEYIFTTSRTISYLRKAILGQAVAVNVTAVFDWLMNEDTPGRFAYELLDAGVRPVFSRGTAKLHAKTLVVDGAIVETGSYNPTGSATRYNDESIVLLYSQRLGRQAAGWIRGLAERWSSDPWSVDYHPVIVAVGVQGPQFIEVGNPTREVLNLSAYLVGDAETVFPSDSEGLYRFPEGAVLEPGGRVIVAFNATEFREVYGFWPDYEIVDSTPLIPDMELYLPDRFGGNFSLDPAGDEAVLAMISPYDPEFLYIVDMIVYGNSTALPGVENAATPAGAMPVLWRLGSLDSVDPARVTGLTVLPVESAVARVERVSPGARLAIGLRNALLELHSNTSSTLVAALSLLQGSPGSPADGKRVQYVYDVVARGGNVSAASLRVYMPPTMPGSYEVHAMLANGTWVELPFTVERAGGGAVLTVELPPSLLNGTPVVVSADPPMPVAGRAGLKAGGWPATIAATAAAVAALALAVTASRRR